MGYQKLGKCVAGRYHIFCKFDLLPWMLCQYCYDPLGMKHHWDKAGGSLGAAVGRGKSPANPSQKLSPQVLQKSPKSLL